MVINVVDLLGKRLDEALVLELSSSLESSVQQESVEDRHYCSFHEGGISVGTNADRVIETVFLYPEGRDGFRAFDGDLPGGLRFDASRREARARLGVPAKSGGGTSVPFLGEAASWDVYFYPSHSIHLEFDSGDGRITLVTVSSVAATPGR